MYTCSGVPRRGFVKIAMGVDDLSERAEDMAHAMRREEGVAGALMAYGAHRIFPK